MIVHFASSNHAFAALRLDGSNVGGRKVVVRKEAPWELKAKKKRKSKPRVKKPKLGKGGGDTGEAGVGMETDDHAQMVKNKLARQWATATSVKST